MHSQEKCHCSYSVIYPEYSKFSPWESSFQRWLKNNFKCYLTFIMTCLLALFKRKPMLCPPALDLESEHKIYVVAATFSNGVVNISVNSKSKKSNPKSLNFPLGGWKLSHYQPLKSYSQRNTSPLKISPVKKSPCRSAVDAMIILGNAIFFKL